MKTSEVRVAFVISGNPIVTGRPLQNTQAKFLSKKGIKVTFFEVSYGNPTKLFSTIKKFKNFIHKNNINLIHVHYGLFGWIPLLSFTKIPLIISFMGSDLHGGTINSIKTFLNYSFNRISSLLIQPFPQAIIVKSEFLKKYILRKNNVFIVPNGVELNVFFPENNANARAKLGLNPDKSYVLFLGDKSIKTKNFSLLENSLPLLNQPIELLCPYPVKPELIPEYLNATDILVLPSKKEGSPNVVKEAMACNTPVVSTDVGDIRWLFHDTNGCFITPSDPNSLANKISEALQYSKKFHKTKGRDRIINLGLDAENVSDKLLNIYQIVLQKNNSSCVYS